MIGAWLFLRLLAVVYLVAFASLFGQIEGLIGQNGIAPYSALLDHLARSSSTLGRYWLAPSVLWALPEHPFVLRGLSLVGCGAAIALLFGRFERTALIALWGCYLSFVSVDYVFLQYQWDHLLLEAGLLAIFLPARDSKIHALPRLLLQLLLFRLLFGSGLVKILSGDPAWESLTALRYHYLTQPLPNLPAYYLAKLPAWFHTGSALTMFVIELVVPFFFFGPRRFRAPAVAASLALQGAIFCSGNYTFFNILTAALSVTVLDDRLFQDRLPTIYRFVTRRIAFSQGTLIAAPWWATSALASLLMLATIQLFGLVVGFSALPEPLRSLYETASPLRAVNSYGLFAVMTTERLEIVIETSSDFNSWKPQRLRYKPEQLGIPPIQIAPYHPRLDWQLWFASLGTVSQNRWFVRLMELLLKQSPEVIALFADAPQSAPPRFIRALSYRYRFSSLSEQAIDRSWWKRELVGLYCPPLRLNSEGRVTPVTVEDINTLPPPESISR